MIVKQVRFEVNGQLYNDHVTDATLSVSLNRGYNVATLTINRPVELGNSVSIRLDQRQFDGFVYRVARSGHKTWNVECRTETAKLTTPFDPDQDIFEPATTATELCQLFQDRSGITIEYNAAELHFGRSFKRSGTMLDSLLAIARVTGSRLLCTDDNKITIDPVDVPDTSNAIILNDSDIIDYAADIGSLESFGISTLIISSDSSEVTSRQKHTLEVDNCSGRFVLYPVPASGVTFLGGVTASYDDLQRLEEEETVDNATSIELKGEIDNVVGVSVNGFALSNWSYSDCFVNFASPVTGQVKVTYDAKVIRGQVTPQSTPAGVWWLVRAEHNGEAFSDQGFLECSNNGSCDYLPCSDGSNDPMCVFMPERRNYVEGFDFWTHGGGPVVRPVGANLTITRSADEYIATLEGAVEHFSGASDPRQTRIELAGEPLSVEELFTEATDSPSWTIDGKYLVFPADYGTVKVAYKLDATKFHVQGDDQPHDVKIEVANACNGVTGMEYWKPYDVQGFDKYDLSSYPCELNQTVPVDIAGSLGVLPNAARGKSVSNVMLGSFIVETFGFIFVTVQANGEYEFDCSSIVHGGEVTLKVNV